MREDFSHWLVESFCDCDYCYYMIDRMRKQANGQHAYREENEGDEDEEEEEEKVPFALCLSLCVFLLVVVCFYSSRTFAFALATIYRFLAFAFTSRVVWIETRDAYSSREYAYKKKHGYLL